MNWPLRPAEPRICIFKHFSKNTGEVLISFSVYVFHSPGKEKNLFAIISES